MKRVYKWRNIKSRPLEIHIRSTSIECCCNDFAPFSCNCDEGHLLDRRRLIEKGVWYINILEGRLLNKKRLFESGRLFDNLLVNLLYIKNGCQKPATDIDKLFYLT